jgi:SAM-dependent methyltransferase
LRLTDILACPACHGRLDGVKCTACGRSYGSLDGVLDLTPVPPPDDEVLERWNLWEALQANGESAYEIDPPNNLSVGEREDVRAFARFAQLEGRVLDVGCGPQVLPSYAPRQDGEFVGIDPLLGEQPRRFAFVKGIAEYLPFTDAAFDRVLFATSIDHVLSPRRAVAEAARVTKPGGTVVVWVSEPVAPRSPRRRAGAAVRMLTRGELRTFANAVRSALPERARADDATMRVRTAGATMTFKVPEGAIDAFHFMHPDAGLVEEWMVAAGLAVDAIERPLPGHCFIRARR